MDSIFHNIRDLNSAERSVAERLVGHALDDSQRLQIQVLVDAPQPAAADASPSEDELPAWCNVYAGLSDARIAELELAISRRLDLSRTST